MALNDLFRARYIKNPVINLGGGGTPCSQHCLVLLCFGASQNEAQVQLALTQEQPNLFLNNSHYARIYKTNPYLLLFIQGTIL